MFMYNHNAQNEKDTTLIQQHATGFLRTRNFGQSQAVLEFLVCLLCHILFLTPRFFAKHQKDHHSSSLSLPNPLLSCIYASNSASSHRTSLSLSILSILMAAAFLKPWKLNVECYYDSPANTHT